MSTQTSTGSLVKYQSLDTASRALALAPAADPGAILDIFYDTSVEIARELAAQQPLALLANLVARESVSDFGHMLTLLSPEKAAKSIIALLVTDDEHQQEFMPIGEDEAQRLASAGQADRIRRRRGGFWWARWEAKRVCEDFALQLLFLVLEAKADPEWKVETLNELGTGFIAFTTFSTVSHANGHVVDRVRAVDESTADAVEELLRLKGFDDLAGDVFVAWEELTKSGDIFLARERLGIPVEVSDRSLGDLLGEIR